MWAQLIPLDQSPSIELVKDLTVIGRAASCDVRLEHKSVSKLHCVLVKTDGALLLRDLGSTNGTRVNGQRVRRAVLLPNDLLLIAACRFRVLFGPEAPSLPSLPTQQMPAEALAKVAPLAESDADPSSGPRVRTNLLPDTYETEEKTGKAC